MKYFFTVGLLALFLVSCTKYSVPPGPYPTSNRIYVPNWKSNVFMGWSPTNFGFNSSIDSIVAYSADGASKIRYKGVDYDIWIDTSYQRNFSPNSDFWQAIIGPSMLPGVELDHVLLNNSFFIAANGDTVHRTPAITVTYGNLFNTKVFGDNYQGK